MKATWASNISLDRAGASAHTEPEPVFTLVQETIKSHTLLREGAALTASASPLRDRGGSSEMVVEELTRAEDLNRLEADWTALQVRVGRLPFTGFAWNSAWWAHFSRGRSMIQDELALRTVRTAEGQLVAVAPLMLTSVPARGPLHLRCLQFFGADPNITEVRGPLVDPDYAADAYEALTRHVELHRESWHWFRWDGVPERELDVFRRCVPDALPESELPECVVELRPSWTEFLRSRPRNVKESLRHGRNSLARAGLVPSFAVARTPSELAPAIGDFLRLHAARAAWTDSVRHADFFSEGNARAFLADLCRTDSGIVVFTLVVEGRVIAARIGFVVGEVLYLYYSGYDPSYARFGVMTTLVAEAMKYAIGQGLRRVNLSPGVDVSKTRWAPTVSRTFRFSVPSRQPGGQISRIAYYRLRGAVVVARRLSARFTSR